MIVFDVIFNTYLRIVFRIVRTTGAKCFDGGQDRRCVCATVDFHFV